MRGSIIIRLIFFVVAALLLQSLFFYFYMLYDLRMLSTSRAEKTKEFIYEEEQYSLRDLVETSYSILQRYYDQSQDIESLKKSKAQDLKRVIDALSSQVRAYYNENKPLMDEEELRRNLMELVGTVRFDGDNYVWINDTRPYMVMHPIKPALDGQDLREYKDPEGTKLFVDMVEVCEKDGEGMVSYMWSKPGEKEPKLKVSFVRLLPELGWIIGTGAWVEDLTETLKKEAMAQIGSIRMADGNYFWIKDLEPKMIMHPIKPELNGKPLNDYVDAKGDKFFVKMAQACRENGEGFIQYFWTREGEEGDFPKLSYVKLFKPWGWIVGMGVDMDKVELVVEKERNDFNDSIHSLLNRAIVVVGLIVLLFVGVIIFYIRQDLKRPLKILVGFAERVASGDLDSKIEGKFKGEIRILKSSIERMVASLKSKMLEANEKSREAEEESERARRAMQEAEEARKKAESAKREGMLEAAGALEGIVVSLTTASEELSAQASEINIGAEEQKRRIAETATSMEEMNATILEVAKNSSQAAENADNARGKAQDGAEIVTRSIQSINMVQEMAVSLKENMDQLGEQAEAIGQIMNVTVSYTHLRAHET